MKERELYLERIQINQHISMQVDPDNQENVLIYQNEDVVEVFSLKRRIYTLFKVIQQLVQSDTSIQYNQSSTVYAGPIQINDHLFMEVTDEHPVMTVEFYTKHQNEKQIHYLTKMTYMSQKLFNQILIAIESTNDPEYQDKFPKLFKDMMDIIHMITI